MKTTGYQGTNGAYSHIASKILSPNSSKYIGYHDFFNVFAALENNEIDNIVIPIENSYAGRVADVHRLIAKYDVYFHSYYILKINHQLLVNQGVILSDIYEIQSHEQAIMQCEGKLKNIFKNINPDVKFIKTHDTAESAKKLQNSKNGNTAVIASSLAAIEYNLSILIPDIQDVENNFTTFILMDKNKPNFEIKKEKIYITSILFTINNQFGGIAKILSILAKYEIDLTKIESYIPCGIESRSADFFITCKGHIKDYNLSNAINEIQKNCLGIKIFGCYYHQ